MSERPGTAGNHLKVQPPEESFPRPDSADSEKHPVRARYLPVPSQDAPDSGRVILRDGTTATLRVAQPADKKALMAFFEALSKASTLRRFQSLAPPSEKLISFFCNPSNPKAQLTLIVTRTGDAMRGFSSPSGNDCPEPISTLLAPPTGCY